MIPRITIATTTALLLAFALSACAGPPADATAPSPTPPKPTPQSTVETAATPTPEPTSADPTCETIISAGTVSALSGAGWTAQAKEFIIGGVAVPEGLLCFWADYTVATDHGQLYGWAEMSAADAAKAQSTLLAEGWQREDGPQGIYITENAQYAMGTDDDGYGMTYLFGDGWVKFADTRQGLILIDWTG